MSGRSCDGPPLDGTVQYLGDAPHWQGERFDVPVDEQRALPRCHDERVDDHPDSLRAEHRPGGNADGSATDAADTTGDEAPADDEDPSGDAGQDRPVAEARADPSHRRRACGGQHPGE